MADKGFKIGDTVVFTGISDDNIKNGVTCEIIADKGTPYKTTNPTMTREIYPDKGYDFVIIETAPVETKGRTLIPFISVLKTEISHHKKS